MEWLWLGIIVFLLVSAVIYNFFKVCKDSKKCGFGLLLSIISPFCITIGFCNPSSPLTISIGCISFILNIIGLYLVIKYRQYLRDWIGIRKHNFFNGIFDKIFKK